MNIKDLIRINESPLNMFATDLSTICRPNEVTDIFKSTFAKLATDFTGSYKLNGLTSLSQSSLAQLVGDFSMKNDFTNLLSSIDKMNKALFPTLDVITQGTTLVTKNMDPFFNFLNRSKPLLASNEFQAMFQGIIDSNMTKGLVAFSQYAESVEWDQDILQDFFNKCDVKELEIKKSDELSNVTQMLFFICALFTGKDFSAIIDGKKRIIFFATLLHFLVQKEDFGVNSEAISKMVCITNKGCVVRAGPSYSAKRMTAVAKGFVFKKLKEEEEWTKIEFYFRDYGLIDGWVKSTLLDSI